MLLSQSAWEKKNSKHLSKKKVTRLTGRSNVNCPSHSTGTGRKKSGRFGGLHRRFAYKSDGDSSSAAGEKFDFYEEREERLKTINLLLNWMEDDNWWSFAVPIRNDLLLHLESW